VTDVSDNRSETELRGHIARNNPHAKTIIEATKESKGKHFVLETAVMFLFNEPT
jgi:transcriptional regulator